MSIDILAIWICRSFSESINQQYDIGSYWNFTGTWTATCQMWKWWWPKRALSKSQCRWGAGMYIKVWGKKCMNIHLNSLGFQGFNGFLDGWFLFPDHLILCNYSISLESIFTKMGPKLIQINDPQMSIKYEKCWQVHRHTHHISVCCGKTFKSQTRQVCASNPRSENTRCRVC